jgi:O-antigen/teichoic acid export membrane protein
MIEVLFLVVLPIVLGVFFLADAILLLLYGDKFVPASVVLRILVWHLPLMALSGLLDQVLVVSTHEKTMLRIVTIDWVVNGVCSITLISIFGLIGTALSSLLVRLVDVYLHYAFVSRQLASLRLLRLFWKPIVASLCMAIPLLGISHHSRILAILCAGVVYVAAVLTAMLWESGDIARLKMRYLSLWVE